MRWEDERYVRWYTRNLPEWLAMSWKARGLFGLVLREMDRAGVLRLGKLGPKGLAVVLHAPWVELEAPLQELLDDGCLRLSQDGTGLVAPNYIEAQEAKQSDAARKRASRERARAIFGGSASAAEDARAAVTQRDHMASHSVTAPAENVTECPAPVTPGHDVTAPVTPCLSVPSVPSLESPPACDPSAAEQSPEHVVGAKLRVDPERLHQAWIAATGILVPNGLTVIGQLCEDAAAAQTPPADPTDYAERAITAFVAWAQGCPPGKRPGLTGYKFQEHFGRIQRIVAGLEPAVPPQEEPRSRPRQNGASAPVEDERPRPRLYTHEEVEAKKAKELAESAPPPPEFLALQKKLGGGT